MNDAAFHIEDADAAFRIENAGLLKSVMILWDQRMDTTDMARALHERESEIAMALRIGREIRRHSNA